MADDLSALLCDFGLAVAFEDFPSDLNTSSFHENNTPVYASPEMMLKGTRRSLESDVWAYGCLVSVVRCGYHLLTSVTYVACHPGSYRPNPILQDHSARMRHASSHGLRHEGGGTSHRPGNLRVTRLRGHAPKMLGLPSTPESTVSDFSAYPESFVGLDGPVPPEPPSPADYPPLLEPIGPEDYPPLLEPIDPADHSPPSEPTSPADHNLDPPTPTSTPVTTRHAQES